MTETSPIFEANKMKILRTMPITITFLMMALLSGTLAHAAQPWTECSDRIGLVRDDVTAIYNAGGIGGNFPEKTYWGLLGKLDDAGVKLEAHKFDRALVKLKDFQAAVIAMRDALKPKMSGDDASLLLAGNGDLEIDEGVDSAIICVMLLN
ncbi:MAG: hypothetical protein ACU836_12035 [Gammaproteobacteria bacterium]